jgi:hypothetical protein
MYLLVCCCYCRLAVHLVYRVVASRHFSAAAVTAAAATAAAASPRRSLRDPGCGQSLGYVGCGIFGSCY